MEISGLDVFSDVCYNTVKLKLDSDSRKIECVKGITAMKDYMCLVRQTEDKDWYMLCVKDEFFYCVSAGPLEMVLNSAQKLLKKWGTPDELSKALHDMESWPKKTPLHSEVLEQVYNAQNHEYDRLLRKALSEAVFNSEKAHKRLKLASKAKKSLKLPKPGKKPTPEKKKPSIVKPHIGIKKALNTKKLKLR